MMQAMPCFHLAAYMKDSTVRPADIVGTVYRSPGIDPATRVLDQTGRPVEIANGGTEILEIMT